MMLAKLEGDARAPEPRIDSLSAQQSCQRNRRKRRPHVGQCHACATFDEQQRGGDAASRSTDNGHLFSVN
jgi:hypothetical protein